MQQERKDFAALIPLSTTYIERWPLNNWGWAMRGWAHFERKEWNDAARDYEKGAQYGSSYAQEGLAWLTEAGQGGVKQDRQRAIELYELAAANGSSSAAEMARKLRASVGSTSK
jgi:TPR repeat protein